MKLSVIVPIYNTEKYLKKCIDSILAQSFPDFELILINDGSTDNSGTICDNYAKRDSRIIVIQQVNKGLSYSRNLGKKIAKGEYLSFIDSDDYIHPKMFIDMINNLKDHNADISICNFKVIGVKQPVKIFYIETFGINAYSSKDYLILSQCRNPVVWNKIYKSSLWKNVDFPINHINEDEFVTYKVLYSANRIVVTDNRYYYYRKRKNSIMDSDSYYKKLDYIYAHKLKIKYFRMKKESELKVLSIVLWISSQKEVLLRAIKQFHLFIIIKTLSSLVFHFYWFFLFKIFQLKKNIRNSKRFI